MYEFVTKNSIDSATSSVVPSRFKGIVSSTSNFICLIMSVSINPGATQLKRIFFPAYSFANVRVNDSIAPFDAL